MTPPNAYASPRSFLSLLKPVFSIVFSLSQLKRIIGTENSSYPNYFFPPSTLFFLSPLSQWTSLISLLLKLEFPVLPFIVPSPSCPHWIKNQSACPASKLSHKYTYVFPYPLSFISDYHDLLPGLLHILLISLPVSNPPHLNCLLMEIRKPFLIVKMWFVLATV